jgi:hypothetical protein
MIFIFDSKIELYPLTLTLSHGGERGKRFIPHPSRKRESQHILPRPFGERDGVRGNNVFRKS